MTNVDCGELLEFNPKIILILCLIPVVYIWTLPLLSYIDFSEDGCYNGIEEHCKLGHSISAYISNSQATGAMAFAFSFPITIMWLYKPKDISITPLIIFTLFFGLFLICSVTYNINLHLITVFTFCFAAIFHFILFTRSLKMSKHVAKFFWFLIIVSSSCLVLLMVLGSIFMKNIKKDNPPLQNTYWVWIFECIGLTSFILFTPTYLLLNNNNS